MRFILVAAAGLALTGCVPAPTPEQQAERQVAIEEGQTRIKATVTAEWGPLVPLCLAQLERGVSVTDAQMAALGYRSGPLSGYTKPRGDRIRDRINSMNTTFNVSARGCTFGLGNFGGVQAAGVDLRQLFEAQGYVWQRGALRNGFLITKGTRSLAVRGSQVGSSVLVSVAPR